MINLLCFGRAEIIALAFTPVPVVLRKGIQRLGAYTVHMPVGMDEVHPFLAAVVAGRTVKEVVCAWVGLIQQGNEVVLHGGLLCHKEAELTVHGF